MKLPGPSRALIAAIFAYAAANVVLYAMLLPLWEGFDEPFHYGYVRHLAAGGGLTVLGSTGLPWEVWRSLELVPVSGSVRQNLRSLTTFDEYRRLPAEERDRRRGELERLRPDTPHAGRDFHANYEAHQAPAGYVVLAAFDALVAGQSIVFRVVFLRVLCGLFAAALTGAAVLRLSRYVPVAESYRPAALFVCFSIQTFYAATVRVGNDWLSIPAVLWIIVLLCEYVERPAVRSALLLGLVLAFGLLAKAYVLAFVPVCAAAVLLAGGPGRVGRLAAWLGATAIAVPWYARNLYLYGSLTGMQEAVAGVGARAALAAASSMSWPHAIVGMARSAVWIGNNHFLTFSLRTTDALLWMWCIGTVLFCWYRLRLASESLTSWAVFAAAAVYAPALAYAAAIADIFTGGASSTASAWYIPPLVILVVLFYFSAASAAGRFGPWLGAANVLLCGYIIAATYAAKLVPLYAGVSDGRARLRDLVTWYFRDLPATLAGLRMVVPGPPTWIYGLTAGMTMAVFGLSGWIVLTMREGRTKPENPHRRDAEGAEKALS